MLEFRKRGKGKNNADFTLKDCFKRFKKESKEVLEAYNITQRIYTDICTERNYLISTSIIYHNLEYKLPFRLGRQRIQKRNTKIKG